MIAIGHVPIHALRNDNRGASYWNDALNYASTGSVDGSKVIRDVVYLHGHNHTSESTEYFIRPAVPVLKTTVKSSSEKTKLIWNEVKGASDYRVAYRKAGAIKWTRKWANGKTTYTVSGLKKKGLYEFRAAAASESGNSFIYSKDSKTKYRYINKLFGVKAIGKPVKKRIKVSWNKDGKATGYQIVYATNKDMKNAVKIKVKGSTKTYTIKKLKRGKTYYVRL